MDYKKTVLKLSQAGRKSIWLRKILMTISDLRARWLSHLSDEAFAQKSFSQVSKKKLNLRNPKTYNEKLWWLKYHYRDPLMQTCSDKYTVRKYVNDCGLSDILVPIVGVYNSFDDVPLKEFQQPVFLKCTKGSGGNTIYDPVKPFDLRYQRMLFKHKLHTDYAHFFREWNYCGSPNRILCETVLRSNDGKLPEDYKFLCFAGIPKLLFFSENVSSEDGQHNVSGSRFVNVYDAITTELLPIKTNIPPNPNYCFQKPKNYEKMLKTAELLSSPFPFCRVDLYNINGKVYFGEITFFPSGGNDVIQPDEWSLRLGEWINA